MIETIIFILLGTWSISYLIYRWLPFVWQPILKQVSQTFYRLGFLTTAKQLQKPLKQGVAGCGGGCGNCSTTRQCSGPISKQV